MNTSLAVSPNVLAAYFLNILDGKSMREIGRLQDCQASTVLRRIRKCEDLREHPEWDALFTALEDHQEDTRQSLFAQLSRETILAALKLDADDLAKELPPQLQLLQQADSPLAPNALPSLPDYLRGECLWICTRPECDLAAQRRAVKAAARHAIKLKQVWRVHFFDYPQFKE